MFSSFINSTNLYHGFYGFSRATPFGVWGGPEEDRDVCFCGVTFTRALPRFALPERGPLA